jgi:hypothetical protein
MPHGAAGEAGVFAREIARLKASGALGESGRLAELFAFLAARGEDAEPVSQAEIADAVFGHADPEGDDATVRVYIHRLRKRLDEFYAEHGGGDAAPRLTVPAGTYALRLVATKTGVESPPTEPRRPLRRALPLLAALALALTFFAGWALHPGKAAAVPVNAIWRPFLASQRPIMVVVGDYYIFGEFDPRRPEATRLIRDFDINSAEDLLLAQQADPKRYANTEDEGLNYLPFSSAYGLRALMPVLARGGKTVKVIPASQLTGDVFHQYNVVYVGLISGMGMLEDVNFMNSNFAVGETYDELIDMASDKTFTSDEARNLATPLYYKDYGYLSEFREPGGALVAVVASERETGLRGIAPIVAGAKLPARLAKLAGDGKPFEALFEVTGQQGAELGEKLVEARARP